MSLAAQSASGTFSGDRTVLDSEFARNGDGVGQSHNLYAGSIARLTVQDSYFRDARVGHLIKSRAAVSDIRYNRLADGPGGRSSYELELANGGIAYVVGNLIEQSASTGNPRMVSYATEGYTWPRNALYLLHNTFVDRRPAGGIFLRVRAGDARIVALNNLLIGNGSSRLERRRRRGLSRQRQTGRQVARQPWSGHPLDSRQCGHGQRTGRHG